ncbi:hypothetical protein PybrP1_007718, partial [[Pythium] brassicae (nom. inval.)]
MSLFATTGYTIGFANLRQNVGLKTQVLRFVRRLALEVSLLLIYVAYSVMFTSLAGWRQVACLLLLPVVKYFIKSILKRAVADLKDIVPAILVTVDFFNALYQSKCMQSSGSILATAAIIGSDIVQNIRALRKLFRFVAKLETALDGDTRERGVIESALELA